MLELQIAALLNSGNHGYSSESPAPARGGEDFTLVAPSRSEQYNILASQIPEVSAEALRICEKLRGGTYSNRQRAERAWEAGYWARFTLQGRTQRPRPTTHCDLANTTYVILRAPGVSRPIRTDRASIYRSYLGDFTSDSVSHGFASLAEAKTYCLGAGVEFPATTQ